MTTATDLAVPPRHVLIPEYTRTLGPEVGALATLAGFAPDPEQQMILDATFAIDDKGKSAAYAVAAIVPRQNLKTGVIKQAELGWLFVADERLIVHSAHEFDTAQEAFRDLDLLITGSDYLRKRVKKVHRGNGDEAIELMSGARIKFKARTKGGGRGLSGGKVVLDEAFALKAEHMGALLPLLSAQPDPQLFYASSAGKADSAVLRGIRDRGRKRVDKALAYFEWCMPDPKDACADGESCTHSLEAVGCGLDNPLLLKESNPALGRRIFLATLQKERRELPPEEYGRERGGWWDDPADGVSIIDPEQWVDAGDPKSKTRGSRAFAVAVRPDGLHTTITVAGAPKAKKDKGRTHGEVVEHRPGTGWSVERLFEIFGKKSNKACVLVLDPSGPAGALVEGLLAGIGDDEDRPRFEACGRNESPSGDNYRLHLVGAREYAQACGALVNDVRNNLWRHIDQAPLNDAVEGSRTRPLADAYAWSRKDVTVDIAPLEGVTLARHGFAVFGAEEDPEPWVFTG